ncbi:MAG: AI-2E family transporter [Parcubacteria group bacterium]|nr:AI-2E family transporter [Parcubacteria group bacterium]
MLGGSKDVNININLGTIISVILLVLLVSLIFYLQDLVLVVLTAVVIASAIEPATKWFVRHRFPRVAAVLVVYLMFFSVLLSFFYFLLPPILREALNFLAAVPQYINAFDSLNPFGQSVFLSTQTVVEGFSINDGVNELRSLFSNVSASFLSTVNLVFGGVVSFLLIIIFSFYFAMQETGIDDFLRVITPVKHQNHVVDLWKRSQFKIGRWMQGQLILAAIIGVLVYLGLTILGVKHALLLALIAALFELIPVFGPILASIPAIIVGFVDGGATIGLLVVGLYLIIQQFENHLIYPLVVTKVVGVPPLLVIIALLIGAQVAGFLGIILSVPVAAAIQEFVKDLQANRKRILENETAEA